MEEIGLNPICTQGNYSRRHFLQNASVVLAGTTPAFSVPFVNTTDFVVAAIGESPISQLGTTLPTVRALMDRLMQVPKQFQVLQCSSHNKEGLNGDALGRAYA